MRDARSPAATGFERTPRKMAAEAGIEIEFVRQRNFRKADRVKERRARWGEPRVFAEIRRLGEVDDTEMARVFNLGVGMILVVARGAGQDAVAVAGAAGCPAAVVGAVTGGAGVRLTVP